MHIKEKRKNRPTNRTIRCCWDLIYRSSANERDTRAIYEIVLSMRIHFDCKILENYFRRSFFLVNGYCSISGFHSDLGVHLWKIPLEREFYSQMYLHSRVTHILTIKLLIRENSSYYLRRKTKKKKWSKTASPVSDCFTFFFSVIFSFISSLPLSFFLSYSMLCLFEHQAWTLLCIDATFSPPPSQRDPSNEDNRNEKTVKKGKKIKVKQTDEKKEKRKKYDRETEQKRSNGPATQH